MPSAPPKVAHEAEKRADDPRDGGSPPNAPYANGDHGEHQPGQPDPRNFCFVHIALVSLILLGRSPGNAGSFTCFIYTRFTSIHI